VGAEAYLPAEVEDLMALRAAARECRGCELFARATATVFGEGPVGAPLLLVGEQPGDREDRTGEPFVGPAGQLLDEALRRAGIERGDVYLTNAVKHFKWAPAASGSRRLHKRPSSREVAACAPWLKAEIAAVAPRLVVCLGATAAQSLLGAGLRVSERRGEVIESPGGPPITVTVHPSSILRGPPEQRATLLDAFVADLVVASAYAPIA
jgi:DNA polymerase